MTSAAAPVHAIAGMQGNSLTDVIERHREAAKTRRYEPIGKMLNILLGPDDDAAYMQRLEVRERIERLSKVQGLQIDWGQHEAPQIAWAPHRSSCMFPYGISAPPRISNPLGVRSRQKTITQDLRDYASGVIAGRDGSVFMVLQPVLYIGLWPFGVASLFTMLGHPDHTGKFPALLINTKTREGHLIGGLLELTTAKVGGHQLPFKKR